MDTKDRKNVFSAYMIVIGITGLLFTGCVATPQFDSSPTFLQFSESTVIGTTLFVLRATDNANPSNEMTFNTESAETNEFVRINQTRIRNPATAYIILKKQLDRELYEAGIRLQFSLTDTRGNVTDVNTSTIVFTKIHATDKDNGNFAVVTYTMKSDNLREIYQQTFRMESTNGNIYLLRNLDYENNFFYHFTIQAHDPCNLTAEPADFLIMVKDVQDTPPFFVGLPYTKSILEGTRDNTVLLRVTAIDGDLGIPNPISYFLSTSSKICQDHLVINALTGEIVLTGGLDWGMEEVRQIHGVCTFIVEAREMDKHPENQKGKTVSYTTVTVTILRSNAHALNLQSCVLNPMNCSCICTEQQNVSPNNIVG